MITKNSKTYLLPQAGNFYKANLHCHSTVSDGKLSPEELKKIYKDEGYSVVAFTDHDVLVPHDDLRDEEFLPLHGYELEITEEKALDFRFLKTAHMTLVALDENNLTQICYHREKYFIGNGAKYRGEIKFDKSLPDFERKYTPECVNEVVKTAHEKGFFITYCHPCWSLENYNDYMNYHGFDAMEIYNNASGVGGFGEYNAKIYDDMLRGGEKLFCVATDDNHNVHSIKHLMNDSFGGFVMIKAEALEYGDITSALKRGDFYASQGPQFFDLYLKDGFVYASFSPCVTAYISCANRRTHVVCGEMGELITEAKLPVTEDDVYFRVTITDKRGRHANTRAYFIKDLI